MDGSRNTLCLPYELESDLRRQNPWWDGGVLPSLPSFRRWPFGRVLDRLHTPLAPIVAIRGPRQVGKTTLQMQLIETLLSQGVEPRRILRVQFDYLPSLRQARFSEPVLRIVEWYEQNILGASFNAAARSGNPSFVFLDEVQSLETWDVQLKCLVDHATVRLLVTGSSALQIERGRDSLAGRFQTIYIGPLRLHEV